MDTPSLLQFSFSTFLDSLEHAGKICRVPVFLPITVDGLAAAESSGVVFQRGVAQTSRSGPFPLACYMQRHLQRTDNCNFLLLDGDHVRQILSLKR